MGGSLAYESEVDLGSSFHFSIDVEVVEMAASDEVAAATSPAVSAIAKHMRALLVEDNKVNQAVASYILEDLGCNVTIAADGRAAIDLYNSTGFDVIFMDCRMPGLSGFEATKIIRRIEAERNVPPLPIIALTAYALADDRERCLAAGMSDYISKPITTEKIAAAIQRSQGSQPPAEARGLSLALA
jgi:CheY-like chemotaxis protein